MRRANTAIQRENHPLPTIEELLPKVREAKIFSKLDIRDAFHHIELHTDSRHITTFITSKGLYRYKRMMFGISCAPEIFQKTLERILLGCEGVINFIDDILIFGKDLLEHDLRLKKVLAVLEENNMMLREDKCIYRMKKVHFLGHELSELGVKPLDKGTKIVIPTKLRKRVLEAAHEGHPGIVAMKSRLRTKVWWPKCDKDAENICKACKGCILVSAPSAPNPLKRRNLPSEPWVDIAIDLMGPLPSGDYILVVVDYYTRYKEVKTCRTITSSEIIEMLKEIFSRLGNPVSLTSDNGRQFSSEDFKSFCAERNIRLYNNIPYWPKQNGEVERQNRDILKRLKISQVEKKNWKEALQEYMVMYNSTPHTVTGKTPAELFFRRQFRDKLPMLQDITHLSEGLEMRDRDKELKEKGKEYADRKRGATNCELEVGDKVYVKNMTKQNKLSLNYEPETHTVEANKGGDVILRNDETGQQIRRNVVHLKRVEGQWKVLDDENNASGTQTNDNGDVNQSQLE
ncbi:unnamed protein product [Parnassius mnemosyne]|uniref:RNA-directed DNA polymerase n=1 Tax=Parnassius mnemosyne TaxID=213953 RepID=A0AAV1LR24_9NEOP